MSTNAIALAVLIAFETQSPSEPVSHAVEIKVFASTLSIAKTVSDLCADILVNFDMLGEMKTRFHMTDADRPTFAEDSRVAVAALSRGINEAPSRQAWCDAAYRLYGPNGTMIPGLMRR